MKTISFGTSTLTGSRLAYGCWRLPETVQNESINPSSAAEACRIISAAMEAGYTVFDQADVYGQGKAESIFGVVLNQMKDIRDKICLITKCGIIPPSGTLAYRYDFSRDYILRSCEASLKRMGVENVDLLLLHRPDFLMNPVEVASAFDELKSSGKVREFGVSNFSMHQVRLLQDACTMRLVTNQLEISLCNTTCLTDGTLDFCMVERMTPMAWSPLGGGYLLNSEKGNSAAKRPAHIESLRTSLLEFSQKRGEEPEVVALAWLLKHPSGMMPVVGSLNPTRIANMTRADEMDLSREEWYGLLQAGLGYRLP